MSLSAADRGYIQTGIDALVEKLHELGLELVVEHDFTRLKTFLEGKGTFVNPSFDPDLSDLGPDDFWVGAVDAEGRLVACSAERVLETEHFMELVATGRLWYDKGFEGQFQVERVPVLELSARLSGRISHSGSTFVDPAWRRSGLAMILPYLSRALSFRNTGCRLNTGFVRHSLYLTPVPRTSYGYVHVEKCLDGYFPPQYGSETLYLCWVTDEEFLDKLESLREHPRCPVAVPARTPGAETLAA